MTSDHKRNSADHVKESQLERTTSPLEKEALHSVEADYSGAYKKSSPEEIRLVRKLDCRIMPTLWAMYFLNYVSKYKLLIIAALANKLIA